MSAKPAFPTSSTIQPLDISFTDKASHVYVKVEEPKGLSPKFEGPYPIVNRPTRTTVQVRLGSYVNGDPRLQTYNWRSMKIAHLRPNASEGSRPVLGRRPASKHIPQPGPEEEVPVNETVIRSNPRPARTSRNPVPRYIESLVTPG